MGEDRSEIHGLLGDQTKQCSAKVRDSSRECDLGLTSKVAHVDTRLSDMLIHGPLIAWSTPLKPICLSKLLDLATHECVFVGSKMGINLGIPAWIGIHENKRRYHILIGEDPYVSKRNFIHCVHAAHETDIDVEHFGERSSLHSLIGKADDSTLDLAGAEKAIDAGGARLNALLVAEDHHVNGGTVKESLIVGEEDVREAALLHHTSEYGRGTGLFKEIRRDDEDELAARCQ